MLTYQALPSDLPAILLSFIVYGIVVWIYGRWLRHWFGARAQRFGCLLLAGQLLLLTMHGWPIGEHEWWNHDAEYNIPVAFSTFQVSVGAYFALAIAVLVPQSSAWHRGYWLLLSLGLFVLGQDEFGILHERYHFLEDLYLAGGALFTLFTILIWRSVDAVIKRNLLLLMAGLIVSVIGASVLDQLQQSCWSDGDPLGLSLSCYRYHPLEETFEKLGAFIVIMALLGSFKKVVPPSRFREYGRFLLVVFSLITLLFLGGFKALQGRMDFHHQFATDPVRYRLDTKFYNGYQLIGASLHHTSRLEHNKFHRFDIYGKANAFLKSDFGYAVHIVDQENEKVYAAHEHWSRIRGKHWLPGRIYKESQHIWVPDDVPINRVQWLIFTIWHQESQNEFNVIPILDSSDYQISDSQIVVHEFVIRDESVVAWPADALEYRFANGFVLRGAELPERARPGERLSIAMSWEAAAEDEQDWVQFLHFVHEESGALWNHDQPPLGARLPTRLWYEGLWDREVWEVALSGELAPGRYNIYTGLYRLSDLVRLGVEDGEGNPLAEARVSLGQLTIGE